MRVKTIFAITMIMYLAGCFAWTSLNPADWNEFGRVVVAATWLVVTMLITLAWSDVFDDDTEK